MKIIEEPKKFGTWFISEDATFEELTVISQWCRENGIRYLHTDSHHLHFGYFIVNKESIMAFKLRWL